MAIGDLKDVLHRIKAKLYPCNLPQTEGGYMALTENEATLSVEDVCTTLVNRRNSYRVVIVTQFSSGSHHLKEPRTVTSKFMLSAP